VNIMIACNMMSTLLGYIVIYMNADTHTYTSTLGLVHVTWPDSIINYIVYKYLICVCCKCMKTTA